MANPSNKGRGPAITWIRSHVTHQGDECLKWPFSGNWNGYGHANFEGRVQYAHRVMCRIAHGEPPTSSHIAAHSCGRGQHGCVNPRHLSWKTPRQNQLDRRVHGTVGRRKHWNNKGSNISEEQRAQIRALKGVKNQREIAAMFDISYQHVSLIQRGLRKQPTRSSA